MPRMHMIVSLSAFITTAAIAHAAPHDDASQWRLDVRLKAYSLLVEPATGDRATVLDTTPASMGIASPDGKRIAYIGSDTARVKDGHDFDLFVADVDPSQPSGQGNGRRLTTDQIRPVDPHWLPDGSGIVFLAGEGTLQQVWYIDLGPGSKPVRLSGGEHRCMDLSVASDGRIAWLVHKGSRQKQQFIDLAIHASPTVRGRLTTPLKDQHISGYAISPDARTVAWSGLGSLFLVNLQTSESREIPLNGIHLQLMNHTAHRIAWRPDGKVIAIQCGFLGGIAREFNGDPNAPWPRMFAADKVFFVPVEWTPTPESLKVAEGDNYPSPTADDPKAEVSPSAGDESKPWWVRELPERALGLHWISAAEAQGRIAKHPAPPDAQIEEPPRPMPPWPGDPAKKPE